VPSFLAADETEALLVRSKQLLDSFDINNHPLVRHALTGNVAVPSNLTRGNVVILFRQTKFTTGEKDHVGDEYFLNSGDKMYVFEMPYINIVILVDAATYPVLSSRYFLEVDAVDKDGRLTREKQKAVNKIGHGSHLHSADSRVFC
jgi:phytanoyl-CoA hydroxylase